MGRRRGGIGGTLSEPMTVMSQGISPASTRLWAGSRPCTARGHPHVQPPWRPRRSGPRGGRRSPSRAPGGRGGDGHGRAGGGRRIPQRPGARRPRGSCRPPAAPKPERGRTRRAHRSRTAPVSPPAETGSRNSRRSRTAASASPSLLTFTPGHGSIGRSRNASRILKLRHQLENPPREIEHPGHRDKDPAELRGTHGMSHNQRSSAPGGAPR